MSERGGGNTRETHVDSNEGGGQEESGGQDDNNNNGNKSRGRVPPKRGGITKKIIEDVWGSLSSPRAPPSTKAN